MLFGLSSGEDGLRGGGGGGGVGRLTPPGTTDVNYWLAAATKPLTKQDSGRQTGRLTAVLDYSRETDR